jgi:hypothetical protein
MRIKGKASAWTLLLSLSGLSALASAAESDTITTDRPDFVESSQVVGVGAFQVETSVSAERTKRDGIKYLTYATPTLLRFGITDTLEIRVETNGRMRATAQQDSTGIKESANGWGDTSLGVKWHAVDASGWRPSMAVLAHVDLDSGSEPFRAAGKGGSLRVAAEWELPRDYSLGIMPGVARQTNDSGKHYTSAIFGVVLGKEITERWRTFVEYSAPEIARADNGGSVHTVDVGTAYLLTKTVQVDTAVSRGLNQNTPDWSLSLGLSAKF